MDLETWVPSCSDKTTWPDCWWDSRDFTNHVLNGNIAKYVIGCEIGEMWYVDAVDVEAKNVAQFLADGRFSGSKGFTKRLRKLNITSFEGAMDLLMKDYTNTYEKFIIMTYKLYLLNCGDPRAEAYIKRDAVYVDPRAKIEKELIRRAEIEDAVLIAREKQYAALQLERTVATEKANRLSQSRQERAESNARMVIAREAELAARTNKKLTDKINTVAANPARDPAFAAKKVISIEQAKQHKHDLKEREKLRVANLEEMWQIVRIGYAI